MSKELSSSQIERAFDAIGAVQDQAEKLRGHIDWLQQQLTERDELIERLSSERDAMEEQIDALQNPID